MNKKLTIKLKSDLCAGSGKSLGSLIDTDICYDEYGLAYIPSKRIKGLLREAFIEYINWAGKDEKLQQIYDELMGKEGSSFVANLKIDNAYIDNIDNVKKDIENVEERYKKYLGKQRVINTNTYTRYQTAVDIETGVAKDNSLRSTRVLNAGTTFVANVECKNEEEAEILEKCFKLITHMGTNRTRGYGEIVCNLDDAKEVESSIVNYNFNDTTLYKIDLLLKADSNIMTSKQNSEISEDYISGSNIMGAIANKYIEDKNIKDFSNITKEYEDLFLNGNVKYSNAYIAENEGNIEYFPAPLSFTKVKNTKDKYHNKMFDVNEQNIQLSNLSNKYVTLDGSNYIKDVKLSEHYHHQRAKDLSIGHVSTEENGGTFYQFTSIDMGQYFKTYIEANGENARKILKYLKENDVLRVGKSRTAEYGKMIIKNIDINEIEEESKTYKNFAVILTSALILFDEEKVKIANDKETLIKELKKLFNCKDLKVTKSFIGYSDESGYNAIWNLPKEQVSSYEKGTTICFTAPNMINLKNEYCLGLRTNEGYGKIKIYNISENGNSNIELKKYKSNTENVIEYKDLQKETKKILKKSIKQVILEEIQTDVFEKIQQNRTDLNNTTIGRILLMIQESSTVETLIDNIKAIKDIKKMKKVMNIIGNKENLYNLEAFNDYKEILKISNKEIAEKDINKFMLEYIKQFFMMLKIKGGESND